MKKVIKNGTIVTATDTYQAEILVENGVISQIGRNFSTERADVVDEN